MTYGDELYGAGWYGGIQAVIAVVQDTAPPRVLITGRGLMPGQPITVYRIVDGEAVPVRGGFAVLPDANGVFVITDASAPFGVPVEYRIDQTDTSTGVVMSYPSNVVTLIADGPWLTLPITGEAVQLTIVDWPEKQYAFRGSVIGVAGRVTPIVVSDKRLAASSTLTVLTRTREELMALRDILATGDVIQIRPVCGAVEAEYVAVLDVNEQRFKPNSNPINGGIQAGSDWRRLVVMPVQVVDEPPRTIPAIGDTLADLHTYAGGPGSTLEGLATATFPEPATLLTIAQTALSEL